MKLEPDVLTNMPVKLKEGEKNRKEVRLQRQRWCRLVIKRSALCAQSTLITQGQRKCRLDVFTVVFGGFFVSNFIFAFAIHLPFNIMIILLSLLLYCQSIRLYGALFSQMKCTHTHTVHTVSLRELVIH